MIVYLVLCAPLVAYLLYRLATRLWLHHRKKRRELFAASPFPLEWRIFLTHNFSLYRKLPSPLQRKLERCINIFLNEKVFVGCNGCVITDEIRVLIAAQACLLILGAETDYYPGFKTILVYPETYIAKATRQDGVLRSETVDARAGESWYRGPVIVAWDQVLQGAREGSDGHNVVLHEFAHKLDEANSHMDGLPVLPRPEQYSSWAAVLTEEFNKIQSHKDPVINSYGATTAAEFFAVVTETFFEKPRQLQRHHPQLYRQFALYYQIDPATWGDNKDAV